MKKTLFSTQAIELDLAALIARLVFGSFIVFGHGWFKVESWMNGRASTFAISLGLGAEVELALAIFSEIICGAAIIIGFQTRLATIPLTITMAVAAFSYHWSDPLFYMPRFASNKEFALVYGTGFFLIYLLGSGKYSIDYFLKNKNK